MIITDLEHLDSTPQDIRGGAIGIFAFAESFSTGRDAAIALTLTRSVTVKLPVPVITF